MNQTNLAVMFIAAICATLWGGYKISKASYTALAWEKTEGTVIDFERKTWTCGKGVSECYDIIVGYHAGENNYTIHSDTSVSRNKPTQLLNTSITVYYKPTNPSEAVLTGKYGTLGHGITVFILGIVFLIISWFVRKSK